MPPPHLTGRFQNLVHRPSPKPTSPILMALSDLDGIPAVIQHALGVVKGAPEDADTELLKRFLIWMQLEHALPGLAKAFVAENDCR